jgi:copper chaperone
MPNKTFTVPNISCSHCVMTIKRELGELEGVTQVDADPATRRVTVQWNEPPRTWKDIRSLLEEINFPPQE